MRSISSNVLMTRVLVRLAAGLSGKWTDLEGDGCDCETVARVSTATDFQHSTGNILTSGSGSLS